MLLLSSNRSIFSWVMLRSNPGKLVTSIASGVNLTVMGSAIWYER